MSLFVRRITKPALWSDLDEPGLWAQGDFPFPALQELADGRKTGLSCFELKTRRDPGLRRIAAALALGGSGKIENIQFRFIELTLLERLNLQAKKTEGKTPDKEVNNVHIEITGLTGPAAIKFARALRGQIRIVKRDEILEEIVSGIRKGYLKYDDVNKDDVTKSLAKRYCDVLQGRLLKRAKPQGVGIG